MVDAMLVQKARFYEQYRLPYAGTLVDDILKYTGAIQSVADIGAGTGQVERLFAPVCDTVYAVDPDAAMRHIALDALQAYPNVQIIDAFAEQIPLPDSSVDFITIGNAYHRFKAEAITEISRILKPDGWVALMSYTFTDHAFSNMLFPRLAQLKTFGAKVDKNVHRLPIERLFGGNPTNRLSYPQSIIEGWDAFWGSAQSGIEAPLPDDDEFEAFEQINREVFDACAVDGAIHIIYETVALLGQPVR